MVSLNREDCDPTALMQQLKSTYVQRSIMSRLDPNNSARQFLVFAPDNNQIRSLEISNFH